MRCLKRKCNLDQPVEDDVPVPEYDELVEYCEFVSLICFESELKEQKAEHRAIDEN